MRTVQVVAALISRQGEVLVQRRPPGKTRGALWEFPGGKVEAEEEAHHALTRECHEELGVNVEVTDELWATHHRYDDLEVHLRLFRAKIVSGEAEPREGQDLRWVLPADLPSLPFVEADIPVLKLIADGEIAL
jgi:8-oxo-dGTP diphosphatase